MREEDRSEQTDVLACSGGHERIPGSYTTDGGRGMGKQMVLHRNVQNPPAPIGERFWTLWTPPSRQNYQKLVLDGSGFYGNDDHNLWPIGGR